ncbi:MAG: AI-2E family transporter, partial [Ilumatobacteraceae bacterium]
MSEPQSWLPPEHMPRWVWKAVAIFWLGYIVSIATRSVWTSLSALVLILLVSLFLSLAIEPGVNRLASRGWRRGTATALILIGVFVGFLVFIVAIGTLVGQQIAELLGHSEKYVNRTVNFLNDKFDSHINATQVIASINDPNGAVQRFIRSQQSKVVDLSVTALGVLIKGLSVLLFTFYLVADGPKLRRAICSRLRPDR